MEDGTIKGQSGTHARRFWLLWRSPLYQLQIFILLFIILVATGVTFYRVMLKWSFRESLLQIVQTVTTLGGNVNERGLNTPLAQWFQIFFIVAILLVGVWGIRLLIEAIVRGELLYFWGSRRMDKRIAHLSNHYIICGFGRMGQEIARQFVRSRQTFVVVEYNPAQIPALEASGYLYVQGDAREDEQLLKAGIKQAKGLIAVGPTDEDNVYVTLTARVLSPELYIVTRCSQTSGEAKLMMAGANRVFSPYIIGGRRMAQAILQPTVLDFLDTIVHGEQMELLLEEVTVDARSPISGKTLEDTSDIESLGVHLLGIVTHDGTMLMRGLDAYVVQEGDTFILLGEPESMQVAMKRFFGQEKTFRQRRAPIA